MASSTKTPDDNAAFLAGCVTKSIPVRDVYEHLYLFGQTSDARKDPDFFKNEARELHNEIKQIAQSFMQRHRDDPERLQVELMKEETFVSEINGLKRQYGEAIWGRADPNHTRSFREQEGSQDELNWDRKEDRETIGFYIRCWIVRLAAKNTGLTPRKGKGKSKLPNCSDGEHTDFESPNKSPRSNSNGPPEAPYRAPEPPNMCPATENHRKDPRSPALQPSANNERSRITNIEIKPNLPSKRSLPSTPNKRKAPNVEGQHSNRKLPKVSPEARTMPLLSRVSQRDVYSVPRSPTLPLNAAPLSNLSARQGQKGSTYDTDATYMPSPRGVTAETETLVDGDEVLADEIDLVIHSPFAIDEGTQYGYQNQPIVGPSGTYRNPLRQDSVIPDTQTDTAQASSEPTQGHTTAGRIIENSLLYHGVIVPEFSTTTWSTRSWQEKEDRRELFKLLLSYLNSINQFSPDSYDVDAQERMDNILDRLWAHDAENLRPELGNDFARLHTALKSWTTMRNRLAKFKTTIGYLGQPGEQWKSHLRRMLDLRARAQACIAFSELKGSLGKEYDLQYIAETFNDDLATVFDLLTKDKGCNGAEEFAAIRAFNEELLQWFMEE